MTIKHEIYDLYDFLFCNRLIKNKKKNIGFMDHHPNFEMNHMPNDSIILIHRIFNRTTNNTKYVCTGHKKFNYKEVKFLNNHIYYMLLILQKKYIFTI